MCKITWQDPVQPVTYRSRDHDIILLFYHELAFGGLEHAKGSGDKYSSTFSIPQLVLWLKKTWSVRCPRLRRKHEDGSHN